MPSNALASVVLQKIARKERYKDGLGHARCAMAAQIAGNLATPHREADESNLIEIECFQYGGKIVGIRVLVVPIRRMSRLAKATPVICDNTVSSLQQG